MGRGPTALPFLGSNLNSSSRALQVMRLDQEQEKLDVPKADRAVRLNQFFNSEVWSKDILPILRQMHDDYLEHVKEKKVDPDALKVFDDFIQRLGGAFQLGIGAMERIAKRRLAAAEKRSEVE